MTNYNDGEWHGWNGAVMKPAEIHDKTEIKYVWHDENTGKCGVSERIAGFDDTQTGPAWINVLKFRVVKEHKEPREFWTYFERASQCWCLSDNKAYAASRHLVSGMTEGMTHVREVQP